MNKQINSLQGLRIFLFIIIFFFHADIFIEKDTLGSAIVNGGGGMLAVSVFFVLSGFVTGLKKKKCKIIRNITQKTKKFYPLHILFLIMMAVLPYNLLSIIHTTQGKISLILNSLLLQSWIPKAEIWRGFNGPSWYLSTLVFMFAITPLLEILDDKITQDNKKKVGRYCIIILLAIVISFVLPAIINQNVEYWLYAFPPSRVLDYGSGFFAARLLLEKKGQVFKSQVLTFTCEVFCVLYFSSISNNR